MRKPDRRGSGFFHVVSCASTTGRENMYGNIGYYLSRLKNLQLTHPLPAGFEIKYKIYFDADCQVADGGIIGSARIKVWENNSDGIIATKNFLSSIRC